MIDYNKLSKVVSHALRHEPKNYGLILGKDGWVPLDSLLSGLKKINWLNEVKEEDISLMIELSEKKRHELKEGMIRALYGHSAEVELAYIENTPPTKLYHGTSKSSLPLIMAEGLKPMKRQYVHLSLNKNLAYEVGRRKDKEPVILKIDAEKAFTDGVKFYFADNIWLAEFVPVKFIETIVANET